MGKDRAETAVEQWGRERPELAPLPMMIFGRLLEIAQTVMKDHMNPLFAETGLQQGEFDVLSTLCRSGKPYMLTPTQLYEALMISSGGMTNRIDRLERAGLVERQADPKDRRGKLIKLTEKGKKLIDLAIVRHVENEERLLSALTAKEQKKLDGLLKKLVAAL